MCGFAHSETWIRRQPSATSSWRFLENGRGSRCTKKQVTPRHGHASRGLRAAWFQAALRRRRRGEGGGGGGQPAALGLARYMRAQRPALDAHRSAPPVDEMRMGSRAVGNGKRVIRLLYGLRYGF